MTFTETINGIIVTTISNIVSNLAWFIIIYWGVKTLVRQVPNWLEQYDRTVMKKLAIQNAVRISRKE